MNFVLNKREPQIQNLDILPRMDRSLVDYKKYHNMLDSQEFVMR